jgi:hypothetical protein
MTRLGSAPDGKSSYSATPSARLRCGGLMRGNVGTLFPARGSNLLRKRTRMYGITAVRFEASGAPRIHEVLMGLLAPEARGWDLPPAPVPLIEVIDRLLEGDAIVAVREDASGKLVHSGRAHLQVQDSLHGGWEESIAFPEESNAPGLQDLPRF